MKFFLAFSLTAALAYIGGLYLPWWSIAIAACIVAFAVNQSPAKSFIIAFMSLFALWAVLAFIIDQHNESILSQKIAQVIPLGGSTTLIILVTAIVGGLVAGFAALTGSLLRKMLK
jgi:hypothetical protein